MLEQEFRYFFEGAEQDDPIYKVQILNNLKVEAGIFYNSRVPCEYCNFEHSYNCDFTFTSRNMTIKDIMRQSSRHRPTFALVVSWRSSNPQANLDLIESPKVETHDLSSSIKSENITLN